MQLTSLVLSSPDPQRLADFYRDTLSLPSTPAAAGGFAVRIGHTRLHLVDGSPHPGSHHLAYTIAAEKLTGARRWLDARTELLSRDEEDMFHFDPPFGPADSVYFSDPDGAVLELIARPGLRPPTDDRFDPAADLIGLGEIAVPVASVPEAVAELARQWSLRPVVEGPGFAAVGDHAGLFVLVDPQRPWFPTQDRWPDPTPLRVGVAEVAVDGARSITFANGTVATAS